MSAKSKKIYVDAKGRKWFFHGTAKNGEELTKLLKKNLLSTSSYHECPDTIRYRCRKLTEREGCCEFRGILHKESREFYLKNEHNHPVVSIAGTTPKGNDDYVDIQKKHWRFFAKPNNSKNLEALLKQNWLYKSNPHNQRRNGTFVEDKIYYICRRYIIRKQSAGAERCGFRALFLKANSCLYTIGKHNHPVREGVTPKGKDDFIDMFGKNWPFFTRINDEAHLSKVVEQNCLMIFCQTQSTIKAACRHSKRYCWKQKGHKHCPVYATFLKSNSTLYLRGKHNHGLKRTQKVQKRKRVERSSEEEEEEEEDEQNENESSADSSEEEDLDYEEALASEKNEENQEDEGEIGVQEANEILDQNAPEIEENTPEIEQQNEEIEAMLRPVKKEEPADEQPEEPLLNQPSTSNANANVGPHRMYLRARKPVNYAEKR